MTNLAHIGETRLTRIAIFGLTTYMGNTEGSQVISQTYKARKNLYLHLSKNQLSVVLGSILGDAYIYPQGKICFEQSSVQKEYLFWKYKVLASVAYPKVSKVARLDKRTQTQTTSYRFFLRQFFRPLRDLFYVDNHKTIPTCLTKRFNPLVLAVWYMDDGYLDQNNSVLLMTDSFSSNDTFLLVQMLYANLAIESYITNKNRIRIKRDSLDNFFQLVEPWIHPSLRYKLP